MKTNKAGNANLKVLATATLIRRFHERCNLGEIYDKAIRCYETLIDCIENTETTEEISALLGVPADTIKGDAEAIINILLFNKENDPYLSFGLNRDAPLSDASSRWKSLIVLYHPDKYLNQKIFEEKAKKINEIYAEIQKLIKEKACNSPFNNASRMVPLRSSSIFASAYLKHLPLLIIGTVIIIAIFSIFLLLFNKIFTNSSISSQGGIEIFQVIRISRNYFIDIITYRPDYESLQTVIK